ncbi:MAG: MerR family transcriptional regulator [Desulfobacteraceae bacterium]|nr:MAG: MerR family transcriptional regulator [Desulfobacteraceae bacterium]
MKTYFSIGQAAKVCGVSAKQLRNWQEKGYLPEPERVVCGKRSYRKYDEEDLDLIIEIRSYLDQGFTLSTSVKKAKEDSKKGGIDHA